MKLRKIKRRSDKRITKLLGIWTRDEDGKCLACGDKHGIIVFVSCGNCKKLIPECDWDWLYPQNRERSEWVAGCFEHNCGCGFVVYAPTQGQALAAFKAGPKKGHKS